jgi:hypothetical protein
VITGAGLGGVVSGELVKLTELLVPDRLPAASIANTERVRVVLGNPRVYVNVVLGGSTRKQPLPFVWTQYQNVDESVDAFHASETLFAVVAVMWRLLGVVGALRSRPADAGAAPSSRLQTTAAAMPSAPTDRRRNMVTPS